jgi:hypothetical protein
VADITDQIAAWPARPGVTEYMDTFEAGANWQQRRAEAAESRLRTADELLRAFAVSGIEHETRMYGLMQVDRNDLENARAYLAAREKER